MIKCCICGEGLATGHFCQKCDDLEAVIAAFRDMVRVGEAGLRLTEKQLAEQRALRESRPLDR